MNVCLKCGADATRETADSEEPLCWAHGGGEPPDIEPDQAAELGGLGPRLTWLLLVVGFVVLFVGLAVTQ